MANDYFANQKQPKETLRADKGTWWTMWQKMSLENTLIVAGDFDVRDFCNNVNEDDDDED